MKTADPVTYKSVGDVISYSYVLTNSGDVALSGPFIVTDDKTTATCPDTATLDVAASITCAGTYSITQADIDAGSVTNTASGHGLFETTAVDSAPVSATVKLQSREDRERAGRLLWPARTCDAHRLRLAAGRDRPHLRGRHDRATVYETSVSTTASDARDVHVSFLLPDQFIAMYT